MQAKNVKYLATVKSPPLQVLAFGILKGPTRGSGELPEGRTPKNLHMENLFLKSPLKGRPTRGSESFAQNAGPWEGGFVLSVGEKIWRAKNGARKLRVSTWVTFKNIWRAKKKRQQFCAN
jgi:hypothetical protein